MPRLHLILFYFLFCSLTGFSQNKIKKLISFADEQFKQGDYYYALDYYKQALEKDSNSIELLWKYAETQRAYKNYIEAERYYAKVYAREQTTKYENSLLNLGLMQKQNGNYEQALKTFKLSVKKLSSKNGSWYYKKSEKEVESTQWALKNLSTSEDSLIHLPLTVNSYDAEFPHDFKDKKLVFSSLKADSMNQEEVYSQSYRNKLFYSKMDSIGEFEPYQINKDLLNPENNYGNGTFSTDGTKFYYSTCNDNGFSYTCRIVVADYSNGKYTVLDTLGPNINQKGKNSTMPRFAQVEGVDYLFFCSNRRGGVGGLDIWMAESINGIEFKEPRNITILNTYENEISPWYDSKENKLFFSSTWHNGFGGNDVHYSLNVGGVFSSPINALEPINSPANDMYYFRHNDTTYMASNRLGSYYAKNPTCCSDIYADYPKIDLITEEIIEDTIIMEEIVTKILPITLYFRNDEPDASTLRTTTKQNYMNTYQLYVDRYDYYKEEVAKGLKESKSQQLVNELEGFFKEQVDRGAADLEAFKVMVLDELKTGSTVSLFIRGFASPVANTAYNVNLTKRRISSLLNYFKEVDEGIFKEYIDADSDDTGKLIFSFAPFGEYAADQSTSDDVVIQNESVFSKSAGIERKIEIESMTIKRNKFSFPLETENHVANILNGKTGDVLSTEFSINNASNTKLKLLISSKDEDLKIKQSNEELMPNQSSTITVLFDTNGLNGHQSKSFEISAEDYEGSLQFFINTELK